MSDDAKALDRIDHEILGLLQNNARLTNKELAAAVGLAPSSCLARVQRLIRDEVIRGFHAAIDPRALGIELEALVFVRLVRHSRELVQSAWDEFMAMPEVRDIFYVAGSHDLVVHVVARDVEHLRTLVAERFGGEQVGHIETALIFQHRRRPKLPDFSAREAPTPRGR
ncbi:Lrp/AsnC family transcriptional regulator [Nannocystaceae bacterium ST9]